MKLVVESTELVTPERAGVYTARLGIVLGLLEHLAPEDELVLTHWPVGRLPDPLDAAPSIRRLIGPRHRTPYFPRNLVTARRFGGTVPVQLIKVACSWPEAVYRRATYRLHTHLFSRRVNRGRAADVFLSSEMDYYRFAGATTAAFLHDVLPLEHPEWFTAANRRNYMRKLRHLVRDCAIILTNSEQTRRDAIRCLPLPPDRYFVTPLAARPHFHPADPSETYEDLDRRWGLTGRRVVLAVGTLEPRKNLVRLMEAVDRIAADPRSSDVCLVLAGEVGWSCDDVLARARRMEPSRRLVRTGFVDDATLARLYRRADVFTCVSLYEGFGLPVLEAMQSGVPVVCSNAGALPEVVADAAWLVDPVSVSAMARAIGTLLEDRSIWYEYRRRGAARARAFSWSFTGRRVSDIFRWAAGQGPRPDNSVAVLGAAPSGARQPLAA
jgi:glycosyltransferase involved in cell wall biosynthesis